MSPPKSHRRLLLFCALLAPCLSHAWGFEAHRRLVEKLHTPLPAQTCVAQWVAANQSYAFQNASTEPDRWRNQGTAGYDPQEAPRHYLDIDYADPVWSYPREWPAVEARFGLYAVKNGQVPWRVQSHYSRLVLLLTERNFAEALTTVAHLSHYVTDAFSPLHNTRNSDPNGLHSRYESDLMEVATYRNGILSRVPEFFGTVGRPAPVDAIFEAVLAGNALMPELIRIDLEAGGNLAQLYAGTQELTARRWADALTVMASLLVSAWLDAGRPPLPGTRSDCSTEVPQGPMVLAGHRYVFPEGADAGAVWPADAGKLPSAAGPVENIERPREGCSGCGGGTVGALGLLFAFAFAVRRGS